MHAFPGEAIQAPEDGPIPRHQWAALKRCNQFQMRKLNCRGKWWGDRGENGVVVNMIKSHHIHIPNSQTNKRNHAWFWTKRIRPMLVRLSFWELGKCGGLCKNDPHRLSHWGVVLVERIIRIRRCSLPGGSISLRVGRLSGSKGPC